MRSKIQIELCLCLALIATATGCTPEKTSGNPDAERLQGTWHLVYQQINGTKLPDEKMAVMFHGKLVFAGNKIRYTVELQGFDFEFAYKLHPELHPKAIDLELTDTADKKDIGQKTFGIYVLENDTLRICHSKIQRPTGFTAGEGSHNALIVLERKTSADRGDATE